VGGWFPAPSNYPCHYCYLAHLTSSFFWDASPPKLCLDLTLEETIKDWGRGRGLGDVAWLEVVGGGVKIRFICLFFFVTLLKLNMKSDLEKGHEDGHIDVRFMGG